MNAKEEFLRVIANDEVIASLIKYDPWWCESKSFKLKAGYTEEDYQSFLNTLDFNYNEGYGVQELVGTIWCKNGVWFDRGEYDGSEWWNRNEYPPIPDELK